MGAILDWDDFRAEAKRKSGHLCAFPNSGTARLIGVAQDESDLYYVLAHPPSNDTPRISFSSACGVLVSVDGIDENGALKRLTASLGGVPLDYPWIEVDETTGQRCPEDLLAINDDWQSRRTQ